jgi:hypothetical protein
MVRIIFAIFIVLHGLIHVMGFMRAFNLATISQLTQSISKPAGLLWFLTALLFLVVFIVFLINKEWWWMIAAPAILFSELLIIFYWQDAKFGTIPNVIILAATGSETDQGSLLRYLAEIIWFPSSAVYDYIKWEQIDSQTAKATMTFGGITASGFFKFDMNNDVISFEARRYFDRKDGATLEDWLIEADPDGYKEFDDIRIPARGTVTRRLKEGDYTWLKLEIEDMQHNKWKNE